MAYFPYAYPKMMLATAGFVKTAGTRTFQVAKAKLAVVDTRTNLSVIVGPATTYQNTPKVYLVQGSTHNVDNIGGISTLAVGAAGLNPFHGGYKESVKSREIDPRFVNRFWYVGPQDQTKASYTVTIVGTPADFEQNQSINGGPHTLNAGTIAQDGDLVRQEVYRLRLDLKGSPVLRYLTHNFTYEFDATTKCMPDGAIDLANLVKQWADAINAHPIIGQGKLVTASVVAAVAAATVNTTTTTVSNGTVINVASAVGVTVGQTLASASGVSPNTTVVSISGNAVTVSQPVVLANGAAVSFNPTGPTLLIKDTFVETDFSGDPNYYRTDFHEYEGVAIYASVYDERNLTCVPTLFTAGGVSVGRQGQGFGDTVLKEYILEKEYQLDPYHEDQRLRSVLDDNALSDIDRTRKYGAYYLLYTVPRRQNTTSTLDNDQILIKIPTAPVAYTGGGAGTRDSDFEAFIPAYCLSAGNNIQFENLTGGV